MLRQRIAQEWAPAVDFREKLALAAKGMRGSVSATILKSWGTEPSRLPPADDLRLLTTREVDVLRRVARGLSNSEIAEELVISPLTAKTHVSRILTKLNLASRVHAVIVAYETGLVTPGEQRERPNPTLLIP